jgi:hypothetical protein
LINTTESESTEFRTWTDRSGSFRVEAILLGVEGGKAQLHKSNGVKISVPLDKLSPEDGEFVEAWKSGNVSGQPFPSLPARNATPAFVAAPNLPDRTANASGPKLSPKEIEEMDDRLAQEIQVGCFE